MAAERRRAVGRVARPPAWPASPGARRARRVYARRSEPMTNAHEDVCWDVRLAQCLRHVDADDVEIETGTHVRLEGRQRGEFSAVECQRVTRRGRTHEPAAAGIGEDHPNS